tara:strand:+ start:462 stop:1541 length:1080 start_codon:yes stop_codon:yes gene_type:complete
MEKNVIFSYRGCIYHIAILFLITLFFTEYNFFFFIKSSNTFTTLYFRFQRLLNYRIYLLKSFQNAEKTLLLPFFGKKWAFLSDNSKNILIFWNYFDYYLKESNHNTIMNSGRSKLTDDTKLDILMMVKSWFYKDKLGKEYKKSTIAKERSKMKKMVDSKNIDWETQKNLIYFIDHIGMEDIKGLYKMKDEIEQQKRIYEREINTLQTSIQNLEACNRAKELNMKDRIKAEYEKTFEDKYSSDSYVKMEQDLEYYKDKYFKVHQDHKKEIQYLKENFATEKRNDAFKIAEMTLKQTSITPSSSSSSLSSISSNDKCKRCKKLKREILQLQLKISDMENSSSDEEINFDLNSSSSSPVNSP